MKKTGYLYDDRYLLHNTGPFHPENSDRLIVIHKGIKKSGIFDKLILIEAEDTDIKWIESVHDISYIENLKKTCSSGNKTFNCSDNQICKNTYKVAKLAVGGILKATKKLMEGKIDNVFCAVRPPGHHAEYNQAMGFCYFNNIAIVAKYLQKNWEINRIGIIDIDVHHGNGTQNIFEKDPQVFYYSIHQHPSFSFPGTGKSSNIGVQRGHGFTKNSTILPGQGDSAYRNKISKDLLPAFEAFKPEIILVSAGFDAHVDDNMSDVNLSTKGLSWIMKVIVKIAKQHSDGKIISILEGGYNLKKLAELTTNHIKILLEG